MIWEQEQDQSVTGSKRGGGGGEERTQPLQDSCPKNLGESEAALGATIQRRGEARLPARILLRFPLLKKKKIKQKY